MNDKAKIHLSALELELVNNTQWIFTKQIIIDKVYSMLGILHDCYKKIVEEEKEFLPEIVQQPGGKITKGENYNGLPYLILDYPAAFGKQNIFAVRTMFWWGNFFSVSLHLSGESFTCRENIRLDLLSKGNFFVCVNESEWDHHFQSSNYLSIHGMNEQQIKDLSKKNFFKIAKKIEVAQWNSATIFLKQVFTEIIEFIKISFPDGEKVL